MRLALTTIAVFAVAISSAQADVIAEWNTNSNPTPPGSISASLLTTGLDSGVLDRGPGLTQSNGDSQGAGNYAADGFDSSNEAGAVSGNDYFSLTVNVESGFTADFDDIIAQIDRQGNGPNNIALYYLADGGSLTDTGLEEAIPSSGDGTKTWDVSGISDLDDVTTSVEFRFYGFGLGNDPSRAYADWEEIQVDGSGVDDVGIRINGSVVPEPATMGLLAMGGLALLRRRRA
jgi:hypothetical protein